jgi:hypothetical protein
MTLGAQISLFHSSPFSKTNLVEYVTYICCAQSDCVEANVPHAIDGLTLWLQVESMGTLEWKKC